MVIIEEASPPPSINPWEYHVFLSFRGEDTRNNFTGHLCSALSQNGIITFMDDRLSRGEDISTALLQAIEQSKISIIVFSKDYASSKWCLDELVKILDCKKSKQQIVLPIFFKVDPKDIRNHTGSFGEGLASLECKFKDNMEKVQEWKSALNRAATLSGWPISEKCSEASVIQEIIDQISKELINSTSLDVAKYPVGIEPRVQQIHKLLGVEGRDVHMVGIWGVGGIGKTTIAKAVYNSIAHKFEGSCFLENVRENSKGAGGFVNLQKKLLCEILRGTLEVANEARGITMIKDRLQYKSVLLVLDDVSDMDQLEKLAGECSWFGRGSIIIITTRDQQLLTHHCVDLIYEVQELAHDEALELFSMNAFRISQPLDDYAELAKRAIRYAQGLPLALTVLGSSLCNESLEAWKDRLDGFKSKKIQDVLEISYHGLEDRVKEAFLDIACFFKGESREDVVKVQEACGRKRHDINVLIGKALISVRSGGKIWMHDLIEEMGRDIVHKQSPNNPGEQSRLWFHKDVYRALTENIGTKEIIGIKMELPEDSDVICFSGTTFSNLRNLRLFIYRAGRYSGVLDNVPKSLRVVDWPHCRLQFFASDLPRELVLLNMPRSRIKVFGNGVKHLRYLTSLNLRGCQYLTKVSDISGIPNLQHLDLSLCSNLVEVHPSVGFLDKLQFLSIDLCYRLETFPTEVRWKSMRELYLGWARPEGIARKMWSIKELPTLIGCCTSLEVLDLSASPMDQLPSSIEYLTSLKQLKLIETRLNELPSWIGCHTSLEVLNVSHTLIEELPPSIWDLTSLRELKVSSTGIRELPSSISNLTSLSQLIVSKTLIKELPSSIGFLTSLEELDASETLIEELPLSIGDLICLKRLILKGCANLSNVPHSVYKGLQNLEELDLSWCSKLVTFPSRPSALVSSSAESLPPTNSNNGHDDCGPLLFPSLCRLGLGPLSVSDFLTNLDCVTTLRTLNLSGSSFDTLPACISNFQQLRFLELCGCKNLRNISELPADIICINLDDCVSLERFSKLSNMLEQKDTLGKLREMNLSNCHRLVDNLGVNIVSKMAKAILDQMPSDVPLWYVYPDCRIIFLPNLEGIEVPDWFDSGKVGTTVLRDELVIKIPRTLEGKRIGLVVFAVMEITRYSPSIYGYTPVFVVNKNWDFWGSFFNRGDSKVRKSSADDNVLVCLASIEFKVVDHEVRIMIWDMSGVQPQFSLKSFGVHLAYMQQTDDNRVSGKDLALEMYRPSNSGEQQQDLGRQTKIGRAMLAFLRCFGITCL